MITKTIEWLFFPCKHEYEKIEENKYPNSYLDHAGYVHIFFNKTFVLKCKHCAKIKKIKL